MPSTTKVISKISKSSVRAKSIAADRRKAAHELIRILLSLDLLPSERSVIQVVITRNLSGAPRPPQPRMENHQSFQEPTRPAARGKDGKKEVARLIKVADKLRQQKTENERLQVHKSSGYSDFRFRAPGSFENGKR